MPTYEYQCTKCKKKFEKLQKMNDIPLKKCPHCGGKAQRLISAGTGFIFKGSGFYITDYKKKPAKESKTEPKKSEPAAAPKIQTPPAAKKKE